MSKTVFVVFPQYQRVVLPFVCPFQAPDTVKDKDDDDDFIKVCVELLNGLWGYLCSTV